MKVFLVAACCIILVVSADNPGLRVRITDKLLEHIKDLSRAITQKQAENLPKKIPRDGMPPGTEIKSIKVKEHELAMSDVSFAEPNQLVVSSSGGRIVIEAEIQVENEQGTATATVAGINFNLGLAFGRSPNKKLTISKTQCAISIDTFTIDVVGFTNNAQVSQYTQQAAQQVKVMLPAMLCPQLEMALAMGTAQLSAMPDHVPIYQDLVMNVDLTNDPEATSEYLQFDIKGCIHKEGERPESYSPAPMNSEADTSHMFYMWSSPEMHNNAFREMHKHGMITKTINKDSNAEIYAKVKQHVKKMSDKLGKAYNGNDDVEITLRTVEAPQISLNPEDTVKPISITLKVEVTLKVRPGAADEKVIQTVLAAAGKLEVKIHPLKEGEAFPKTAALLHIDELVVESVTGETVTDEQKREGAEELKAKITKFVNMKLKQVGKAREDRMKRIGKIGKIENASFTVVDANTMKHAFDVVIDADKLFAYAEKNRGLE